MFDIQPERRRDVSSSVRYSDQPVGPDCQDSFDFSYSLGCPKWQTFSLDARSPARV
jgi:hypothetical protein